VPGTSNRTIRTFRPTDAEPLTTLLRESLASGEQAGHSSGDVESIIGSFSTVRHLMVAELDGEPVGLISPVHRFIVVRPDTRRRGIGRALVDAAETDSVHSPDGSVILFPPHNSATAVAFLQAIDFQYDHSLWRFQLTSPRREPLPTLPSDLILATYNDNDLTEYVDVINTVFLDHPVPLHVSREQIEHVHAAPNFDPANIALIRARSGEMVGFCVTGSDRSGDTTVGTINLLGVHREFRGHGLGRFLLLWGIERLRSIGLEPIELGVEAENEQAVRLYRSVGFVPVEEWSQWMRKPSAKDRVAAS
jgi:mycothiol synthase